jgi:3-hydroxyisobutyrate dehydrogenase-like beta-hydroxyacid dehydrogenase
MSTIDPATHKRIAAAAQEKGCDYLDAPVSGGTSGAREGALAIMVGGSKEAYERALPVLRAMGKNLYHCGPTGAGATAKLINQHMNAANALAACEGLVLAAKAGLDMKRFEEDWPAKATLEAVMRDMQDGEKAGVSGTPSVYINGKPYRGSLELGPISGVIQAELKNGAAKK